MIQAIVLVFCRFFLQVFSITHGMFEMPSGNVYDNTCSELNVSELTCIIFFPYSVQRVEIADHE